MDDNQIRAAIKELQDAIVVMARMEARQTDRLLRQVRTRAAQTRGCNITQTESKPV